MDFTKDAEEKENSDSDNNKTTEDKITEEPKQEVVKEDVPKKPSPQNPPSTSDEPDLLGKVRGNPWVVSTIVLGIIVMIFLVTNLSGITGNTITGKAIGVDSVSQEDAANSVLEIAQASLGDSVELVSVNETSGLYQVILSVEGQELPVYVTLDGKNLVNGLTPIDILKAQASAQDSQDTTPTEIPKSDKPVAELFIWAYCPYGVTALTPFAEVAKLLGDQADFSVVLYHDGHGAHETQQNKIQECIQKYDKDKYWDYAIDFVNDIYPKCGSSRDVECDKEESIKLMDSLGINSDTIMTCVENEGDALFSADRQTAGELGVTGSPSLVINGVISQTARTAEAYKGAVCSAFNDAPEECNQELSDSAGTASGSC